MIGESATSLCLSWVYLRYFNVAGADRSDKLDENHEPETHFILTLLESVINKMPFTLFGNDYTGALPIIYGAGGERDPSILITSFTKAKEILYWIPEVPFEDIIRTYYAL